MNMMQLNKSIWTVLFPTACAVLIVLLTIHVHHLARHSNDECNKLQEHLKGLDKRQETRRNDKYSLNLIRLSNIINNTLPLANKSVFEKAVVVRNNLYQKVAHHPVATPADWMNFTDVYRSSVRDPKVGQGCGGMAIIYETALESLGIPARRVQLYVETHQPPNQEAIDSHATVEFWDKGRWIASDPTFNVMFKHNGVYVSYQKLRSLVLHHDIYQIVTNGYPTSLACLKTMYQPL